MSDTIKKDSGRISWISPTYPKHTQEHHPRNLRRKEKYARCGSLDIIGRYHPPANGRSATPDIARLCQLFSRLRPLVLSDYRLWLPYLLRRPPPADRLQPGNPCGESGVGSIFPQKSPSSLVGVRHGSWGQAVLRAWSLDAMRHGDLPRYAVPPGRGSIPVPIWANFLTEALPEFDVKFFQKHRSRQLVDFSPPLVHRIWPSFGL